MGNQADVPFFIHVVIKTSGLNQTINVWVCGSFWLIQNHFRSSTEEGIRSRLYWSWFKVLCVSVCVCVLPAGHCALIRLDSFGVCSGSDSTLSSQTVTHFNCVCVFPVLFQQVFHPFSILYSLFFRQTMVIEWKGTAVL